MVIQPFLNPSHYEPLYTPILCQFFYDDVIGVSVKNFTEVMVDSIYCSSLSTQASYLTAETVRLVKYDFLFQIHVDDF